MKINFKVVIAIVVIVGAVFWAFDSVRSRSYSGSELNFLVGRGPVVVTNPSGEEVAVQLSGTGTRNFLVVSDAEGMAGASTRPEGGANNSQVFEFVLPPGVSTFSVESGTSSPKNISLVAPEGIQLEVTAQPLTADSATGTIVAALVVILAALYYISRATDHRWLRALRGKSAQNQPTVPVVAVDDGGQGRPMRAYGDNTANSSGS